MRRSAGIAMIVTLSVMGAWASLSALLSRGESLSLRTAAAGTRPLLSGRARPSWPQPSVESNSLGAPVTIRNDLPATVTVLTESGEDRHRIPWGGGDEPLGTVRSFTVVCHDPYWPYVYAVMCPATEEHHRIRMSELWHGHVPAGFTVWRGRPDSQTGEVIWFDVSGSAAVDDSLPDSDHI